MLDSTHAGNYLLNYASNDSIRYCYIKAIDCYKKAIKHSRNNRDRARVYYLIAKSQIDLTIKLLDRDQKSKSIQKACFYINLSIQQSDDFLPKVKQDLEESLKSVINKQIKN